MTFLSPDRFGKADDGERPPSPVRTSRVLLWVQTAFLLIAAALQAFTIQGLRGMSDGQLAEVSQGAVSGQSDIDYPTLWIFTGVLVMLSIGMAYCAYQFKDRLRLTRVSIFVAEGLAIPVSFFNLAELSCLIILPAIVVIVFMLQKPAKEWFNVSRTPPAAPL